MHHISAVTCADNRPHVLLDDKTSLLHRGIGDNVRLLTVNGLHELHGHYNCLSALTILYVLLILPRPTFSVTITFFSSEIGYNQVLAR